MNEKKLKPHIIRDGLMKVLLLGKKHPIQWEDKTGKRYLPWEVIDDRGKNIEAEARQIMRTLPPSKWDGEAKEIVQEGLGLRLISEREINARDRKERF